MRGNHGLKAVSVAAVLLCSVLLAVPCWSGPEKATEGAAFGPMGPGPFYRMKLCSDEDSPDDPVAPEVWLCESAEPSNEACGSACWTPFDPACDGEQDYGCGLQGATYAPFYHLQFGANRPNNIRSYKLRMNVRGANGELHGVRTSDWVIEPVYTIHHICAELVCVQPTTGDYHVKVIDHVWQGISVRPQPARIVILCPNPPCNPQEPCPCPPPPLPMPAPAPSAPAPTQLK